MKSRDRLRRVRIVSAVALWVASLAADPAAEEKPRLSRELQAKVDQAVAKGRAFLSKSLPSSKSLETPSGAELLAGYALFKSGNELSTEPLRPLLVRTLKGRNPRRTYDAGIAAMLLSDAAPRGEKRAAYRKKLQEIANDIVSAQFPKGSWNYFVGKNGIWGNGSICVNGGKKMPVGDNLSTFQYALLGLQAASNQGAKIPSEVWERALRYLRLAGREEAENGSACVGWGYAEPGHLQWGGVPSYGSMTAVGVASLVVCRRNLPPGHPSGADADEALDGGLRWLAKYFSVTTHPNLLDRSRKVAGKEAPLDFYYLYSLERAGVFAQVEKMGSHAWYTEGCEAIVARQREDGAWDGAGMGENPLVATSFALLFLKRGSESIAKKYEIGNEKIAVAAEKTSER